MKYENCAAEVRILLEDDGTHSFVFTDGIYGFKVHLDIQGKGHPGRIDVTNRNPKIDWDCEMKYN